MFQACFCVEKQGLVSFASREVEKCIFGIFGHQVVSFASSLQVGYLAKFPNQLFYGYFMSFWSKTPHMTLL